jgi:predicted NBD/HSP70 family sugar kinase
MEEDHWIVRVPAEEEGAAGAKLGDDKEGRKVEDGRIDREENEEKALKLLLLRGRKLLLLALVLKDVNEALVVAVALSVEEDKESVELAVRLSVRLAVPVVVSVAAEAVALAEACTVAVAALVTESVSLGFAPGQCWEIQPL